MSSGGIIHRQKHEVFIYMTNCVLNGNVVCRAFLSLKGNEEITDHLRLKPTFLSLVLLECTMFQIPELPPWLNILGGSAACGKQAQMYMPIERALFRLH